MPEKSGKKVEGTKVDHMVELSVVHFDHKQVIAAPMTMQKLYPHSWTLLELYSRD